MKNVFKSFAVLAAILSFAACQKEVSLVEPAQELYYVSFIAEEPATKTTVTQGTDEEGNKVANYSWTTSDASADRWTVYRGSEAATQVTPSLSEEGVMTITAGFKTTSTTGDKFVALFNKGINAVQNITSESVYDPTSDVMISAEVPYEEGVVNYGFRFNRLGAIAKATVKGLTGMAALTDAMLIATDGKILAADYIYSEKAFATAGSTKISVKGIDCDPDANGFFSFYFITVPTESVNIKMLVSALDDQAEEHLFVKQLGKAIGFEKGNVHAFNVSGFAEVTTKANFNVNGNVTSKPIYQGEPVEFPQNPDPINGYDFVGWSKSEITGTRQEEPEMVDVETEVMGNADVTYYAVFAKTTGHGTATNTITYDTTNIPTTYGDAADITLNDVVFNVTQMYKSGEKMQWRAAGHKNGTGTMYNKDAITSIQSIALTYHEDDTKRNFTVKVGNSANPTDGTDISTSQVDETATYVYDCSAISPSYFVLTNGDGAGYLTSIVITYLDGEPIYSDYCTSIDTRIVTTLSWSAPTATVKLNGDDNEFPTLTADPEEVEAGVEYSSSETSVATINANGEITLIATGETTVTATFPDGDKDYQPSSASYTLIVTAPASHIVTFSINGQTSTQEFDENDLIEFPMVSEIDGVVFRGWSKNTISGTQPEAPAMVNAAEEKMGKVDISYYAVFAKETKASTYTDSKLSSNSFKSNSTYVLAAAESSSATTLHYFSSYTGTTANESWGVTSTMADDAITFTLSGTADALVAKDASGNYLQALATGKFRMSSSSTTLTLKNDGTIYNPTSGSTGYNLRYNHNNGSGGFRWYNGTTGTSAYFYERVADITYTNYCTSVIVVSSVKVSGTPSKTNYKVGESFDVDGLVATAVYSDGDEKTVTQEAEWIVTPAGALAAGTTSVSVVAKYGKVSSSAYPVNITVINVTFEGISIKTAPTKLTYTVGDKFDPAGLVICKNYSDESSEEIAYSGNEEDFSFEPSLDTPLATSNDKVTITYQEKSVNQPITVTVPTFSSLADLAAADLTTGTVVKVTFEDVPIKSIYTTSQSKRQGVYFDIQKGGHDIEIYYSSEEVPATWVAGGTLSGTMTCPWKNFNGTWELAPNYDEWSWTNLTYKVSEVLSAPAIVTQPISANYNVNETAAELKVAATGNPSPAYQWYSNSTNSNENGTALSGETKATYTPSTAAKGTFYYYCVATNSEGSAKSNVATITVKEPTAASLPFTFDGGKNGIESTNGMSQSGLGSDYSSSPKLKFDSAEDYVVINFNEAATKVTYTIKGNGTNENSVFKVMESADGVNYTIVKTHKPLPTTNTENTDNLLASSRFVKFVYTDKSAGNVALGNIKISSESVKEYTLTINTATNGSISAKVGGNDVQSPQKIEAGKTVTLTATPTSGYKFESWTVTNVSTSAAIPVTNNQFTMPSSDVTVSATFTEDTGGGQGGTTKYVKVTSATDLTNGQYLIVYEAKARVFNGIDAANDYVETTITNNEIASTTEIDALTVTISSMTGGYSIKINGGDKAGNYICGKSGSNSIKYGQSAVANEITFSNGLATILSNSTSLRYNSQSGNDRFRYYKTTTTGNNYIYPALYKKVN